MHPTSQTILQVRAKAFIAVIFQIADETLVQSMEERNQVKAKVSQLLAQGVNAHVLKQLEKILLEDELDKKTIDMINKNRNEYLQRVHQALETNQKVFCPGDFKR